MEATGHAAGLSWRNCLRAILGSLEIRATVLPKPSFDERAPDMPFKFCLRLLKNLSLSSDGPRAPFPKRANTVFRSGI